MDLDSAKNRYKQFKEPKKRFASVESNNQKVGTQVKNQRTEWSVQKQKNIPEYY